ncbi:hypothetical protein MAP00_008036 [Monascus purpureus]|nr:hypothetical protein MAP00_008036 [Monascus purpureus]
MKDRHMSLASYLLKYLFIHRSCHVPWNEIRLSRTPPPHGRPCFIPLDNDNGGFNVEFNVSHQASFVALAGTTFLSLPSSSSSSFSSLSPSMPLHLPDELRGPQVGIDITCVDEPGRRGRKHADISTATALAEYVDIFAEVFSVRELETIKNLAKSSSSSRSHDEDTKTVARTEEEAVKSALRLFYTYWALKEAFIKMTGEALLAPWLRELEFTDVRAPERPGHEGSNLDRSSSRSKWGVPYTGTQTWLYGKKVQEVRVEIVGFEDDYLVATAARGGGIGADNRPVRNGLISDPWRDLEEVDIERHIAPCATGRCRCLSDPFPYWQLTPS